MQLTHLKADEAIATHLADRVGQFAVDLLFAAGIVILTAWASNWLSDRARQALDKLSGETGDRTLRTFGASVVRYAVIGLGAFAVLEQLGVKTTSILAALGAASLAIGLALQGAFGNIAAGLMLLIFRPFRVGDTIETNNHRGVVKSLDLFAVELATEENLKVTAPNSKVFSDIIINHSHHRLRRVEAAFRVPSSIDILPVLQGLLEKAKADPRILAEPEPTVQLTAVTENGAAGVVIAWAAWADHGNVTADLLLAARLLGSNLIGRDGRMPEAKPSEPKPPSEAKSEAKPEAKPEPVPDPPKGRRSPRSRPKA